MSLKLSLNPSNTYVLAISGGIDSMVLLDLFLKQKYNIVVVHFNHQKREASIKDHELIKSLCSTHNIPYHYIKLKIGQGNFQDIARTKRYLNLEELADNYQTPYIVTAHHLDDLAETILMKLLRGSNLLGYAGMQPSVEINKYIYLKPLLNYSKDDIISYQMKHALHFLEDQTNLEDDYLRNRIRHQIIPLLKIENDVLSHLNNFSTQSYLASDYIRGQSKAFLNLDLNFSLSAFNSLHMALQMDIISFILESFDIDKSYKKITTILNQLGSDKPNIDITLNKNFHMIKAYDLVYIQSLNVSNHASSDVHLMISHNRDSLPKISAKLCYNKLDFPIQLRKRQKGDKLTFTYGTKKLKDFLIDKKIPMLERNNLNIIVDSSGIILWIPGLYLNETLGLENEIYLSIKE